MINQPMTSDSMTALQETFLTEDDLSDLLWLVKEYGHYVARGAHYDSHKTLEKKLETMLDQLG
ncbi:MAG: hypothetical protein EB168_08190 [Euryarchaeota archaeon]|nr:hypothetical protein [Euryarchaeota archaeon]